MVLELRLLEPVFDQEFDSVGAVLDEDIGVFFVFAFKGAEHVADDVAAVFGDDDAFGGLRPRVTDAGADAIIIRANTLID